MIQALKILKVLFKILLFPVSVYGLFGLFLFIFALERRFTDWVGFFHSAIVIALMFAAVFMTDRLVRADKRGLALSLYVAPLVLVGLVVLASFVLP
jgi:ABC-type phosphate transport system permease subunit